MTRQVHLRYCSSFEILNRTTCVRSSNQFRFSFNSGLDGERASALDNDAKLRAKKAKKSKIESKKKTKLKAKKPNLMIIPTE